MNKRLPQHQSDSTWPGETEENGKRAGQKKQTPLNGVNMGKYGIHMEKYGINMGYVWEKYGTLCGIIADNMG